MLFLKRALERLLLVLICVLLVIMVCLMLWQVFTRYVLATPALFTEETLRFTMIWMALLGTAYCFGTRRHLSLELVIHLCPPILQRILGVFNGLVSIAFAALAMLMGGWQASQSALTQLSPIMQISMGMVYLAVPVAAVLIILLQGMNTLLIATGQTSPVDVPEETL
ncbi:TRAP transporter small permease [Pseudooceanicola sp. CBS1P-1]|uniref:TRAP transporter small permease protein n=1 Tax=Pseudooceanicola albus TaxID=2692189 RepID=A0A6L7G6S7_9RHOB|nr:MULTISPECIES: TRAP transporter small permease [Pseudooceanicola]MBT9386193.1 TRAP transporter small permease [Pseudooceanicola endophyticus]MXN19392.1 TRAP transporter small permease subunit [Pseudooceanicola albus]